MEKMKVCSECGLSKPINKFGKSKHSEDGYANVCNRCKNLKYSSKNRYLKIRNIKCRECGETYPDPFMRDICRDNYPQYSWKDYPQHSWKETEIGTCTFCKINEKYSETLVLYKNIFSKINGYKCPNPECNSIHFYNSELSLDTSQLDTGYIFSLPDKKIKTLYERFARNRDIIFRTCKKCRRSYLEDNWQRIPEEKITESNYLKIKSSMLPLFPQYLSEIAEATEKLIEIKNFNCSMKGVCGILQKHHMALCYDPERLSSEFLLELISGKEAKEEYLNSRAEMSLANEGIIDSKREGFK